MAEVRSSPMKRQREEDLAEEQKKRQNLSPPSSYNQILSLLEETEDQEEQNHDVTSLISTLQQEISSDQYPTAKIPEDITASSSCSSSSSSSAKEDEEENDKESVMRHLLEASDDELGIPNNTEVIIGGNDYESQGLISEDFNDNYNFNCDLVNSYGYFCDGLWELEDEAANYYTLLQSELFM